MLSGSFAVADFGFPEAPDTISNHSPKCNTYLQFDDSVCSVHPVVLQSPLQISPTILLEKKNDFGILLAASRNSRKDTP